MSDEARDSLLPGSAPSQPSAGQMLRAAREAAGLHIAALAVSLKVPVRKLEALESDDLAALPDATFARALASSVCRVLKIDAAPILARLPATKASLVTQGDAGINAPFRAFGDVPAPSAWSLLARPPVLAVIGLGIAILVVALWPALHLPQSAMVTREPVAARPAAPPVTEPVMPPGTATETVMPSSDGPRVEPAPAAAPVAPMPAVAASAAVPAASAGIVNFTASGDSWVEVRDARGALALQRTLRSGETVSASGTPPFAVTVGRADRTRVQVRGRDFDIAPFARDNVARFEVK